MNDERYQIVKVRNGTWRVETESDIVIEHSSREGAEKALLQMQSRHTPKKEAWETRLMDEFCVMFARAEREADTTDWVTKLEIFIAAERAEAEQELLKRIIKVTEAMKENYGKEVDTVLVALIHDFEARTPNHKGTISDECSGHKSGRLLKFFPHCEECKDTELV